MGSGYSEAIGLTQVAVLFVAVAAPLQAGSNLLQSTGHAAVVLRTNAGSVAVNLAASIVLVNVVGLVGVFLGTIVGALVLTPTLIAAIDRNAGADTLGLGSTSMRRALPPALTAAAVGAVAVSLDRPDLATIVVGGLAAVISAGFVAARWSLDEGEGTEIVRALRRASSD